MVLELKLRRVGNSVGLVLPKEALARLNAEDGDALFLTLTCAWPVSSHHRIVTSENFSEVPQRRTSLI